MDRPTCRTCHFFDDLDDEGEDEGVCKRLPPSLPPSESLVNQLRSLRASPSYSAVWPIVEYCDWCGEHPDFPEYLASLKVAESLVVPPEPVRLTTEALVENLNKTLEGFTPLDG